MSDHAEHGGHDAHDAHADAGHADAHTAPADAGHGAHDAHADAGHAAPAHGHAAEAHAPKAAAHGHGAEEAHKPAAHAPAGAKSPIETAFHNARAKLDSTSSQVIQTTSQFGAWINKVLRAGEVHPVGNVGFFKTLPYAAGHLIDGTALNLSRRAVEIAGPVVSGIRAALRASLGTVLGFPSTLFTLKGLKETAKAPLRIMTSTAMAAKNVLMAAPRALHEGINRGIERTVEQINTQVKRIPALGELLASSTNFVGKIGSDISGWVKNTMDWSTSFVDNAHNSVAPA